MKHSPSFRDLPPSELARFLERALDASSSGVVITDPRKPDNPIVYVNPAFERITGYPAEEVLGYNCRFLQGEDREQAALEEVRTAVREEHDCRVVLRNHRKDGAPFWIELHISPVHDEKGRLVNFVGVQNDVSERRGLEDALRKREEQLRLAMRAGHIGMCEWNARADQLTCSEGFAEIFGLPAGSRNPVYGDLLSRVHPEDRGALQSARTAAALDRDSYETEYRVVHSGGGIRWVAERGRIYRDARGCVERTIGIVQDVTEHKLAEEERNALLDRERQAKEWAERAVQRMFVLEQAGAALSASLDYDETLDRITDIFVPNLADCCLVDGVDESG
ncbi:MAG: PAS domain-containing protein, partial [Rubrobacteraceae bacterium]